MFVGAEGGFHPNQVAGTLLYALPLMIAIWISSVMMGVQTFQLRALTWIVWIATPVVSTVLLLTQSRSAILGLAISMLVMLLIIWRWGRWALMVGVGLVLLVLPFSYRNLLSVMDDSSAIDPFVKENRLTFPILLDVTGSIAEKYELRSLPSSFFIDRNGLIQEVVIGGPMAEALLRTRIESILE